MGRQTHDDHIVVLSIRSEKPSAVRHAIDPCATQEERRLPANEHPSAVFAHHVFIPIERALRGLLRHGSDDDVNSPDPVCSRTGSDNRVTMATGQGDGEMPLVGRPILISEILKCVCLGTIHCLLMVNVCSEMNPVLNVLCG